MLEQFFFYYDETAWLIAGTSDSPAPPRPWEMFRAMMVDMCVLCGVGYATMRIEKSAAGEMDGLLPECVGWTIVRDAVQKCLSHSWEGSKMI